MATLIYYIPKLKKRFDSVFDIRPFFKQMYPDAYRIDIDRLNGVVDIHRKNNFSVRYELHIL